MDEITAAEAGRRLGRGTARINAICREHEIGRMLNARLRLLTPEDFERIKAIIESAKVGNPNWKSEKGNAMFTKFSATTYVYNSGHFPLTGRIDDDKAMLTLANNGTTPANVTEAMQAEANRIRAALLRGETVATKASTIIPVE